jgi:hypothetical protein
MLTSCHKISVRNHDDNVKKEVKLSLCLIGERRYSSTILDLDTRCRWVISFTPLPLYPREWVHGTHLLGGWVGSESIYRMWMKEKPCPCWASKPSLPACCPSPCRLNYFNSVITISPPLTGNDSNRYKFCYIMKKPGADQCWQYLPFSSPHSFNLTMRYLQS